MSEIIKRFYTTYFNIIVAGLDTRFCNKREASGAADGCVDIDREALLFLAKYRIE